MAAVRSMIAAVTVAAIVGWAAPAAAVSKLETVREAQWFLDAVHAPQAQSIGKGAGVIVAVVDTGVDASHPDLAGAVLPGASFLGSASQAGRTDPNGHGTEMAGLIAARGGGVNNALGIAPAASILPVAVPASINGSLAEPIRYAIDHGAKVINLSIGLGGTNPPADEAAAIEEAVAHNIVVVVAIGNRNELTTASTLANLPGVVPVSGTTRSGSGLAGSWTSPRVALAAPAEQITTIAPRDKVASGYGTGSGTSEATAIVSGVAALVRSKFPQLNAANVINRLIASAVDLGAPGRDSTYGFGLVDAQRALTMDIPTVAANPLGEPVVAPAASSPAVEGGPLITHQSSTSSTGVLVLVICGAVVLLVVALLIGLVVWLATRRKRPPPPPPPPPYVGVGPPRPPYAPPPPGPRGPGR